MPYEISFRKPLTIDEESIYVNDCCWGGDIVQQQLLPLIEEEYTDIKAAQEDWGWFIWFKKGELNLEVNIMTDSKEGEFRIHVVAARVRFFGLSRRVGDDTPEVHALAEVVANRLREWAAEDVRLEHI